MKTISNGSQKMLKYAPGFFGCKRMIGISIIAIKTMIRIKDNDIRIIFTCVVHRINYTANLILFNMFVLPTSKEKMCTV